MYEKSLSLEEKLPFPQGVTASRERTSQLLQIPEEVGLPRFGVFIPWAKKNGTTWLEVDTPDEVYEAFGLSGGSIEQATKEVLWGDPIPYVAVLTRGLPDGSAMLKAFDGTGYEPVETWATYSSSDTKHVPDPVFLHWLMAVDDESVGDLEDAAASIRGALVYVQRKASGAIRPVSMSFVAAQNTTFNEIHTDDPAEDPLVVSAGETPAMTSMKSSWAVPVVLGALVLGGIWLATRDKGKS